MSGYGYASYGYPSYGSAYYGASYGYYEDGLGGHNTARGALTGPGSSAYGQEGNITSYAHEGYNGGLFEQTTFTHDGAYQIATSYSYAAGYFYYGSDYGAVGTSAAFNQNSYSSYSYVSGNDQVGVLDYSTSETTHSAYGGYDHRTSARLSLQNFSDGSYSTSYHSFSGFFGYSGDALPGTSSTYSLNSSYDASTGYITSYHSP